MSLFIVFIFAAVLLGAGAMLSPAWRTSQPRVALSATFCLALVVGGAIFYAELIAWDTLVVDYLLFALLSGVVLGGTLSTAQARAEAKGERLADRDQGWPGPGDLLFFALVAVFILIPLLHLPAALGTQGQIAGIHSLATLLDESFTSLSPFHSSATVIVAPGLHALSAYLSQQLGQSIPLIQLSVTAVVVFLSIWLAYDFGAEIRDKALGRALAVATLLCGGLFISYLDGHFAELQALLFMQAFLLYAVRVLRRFNLADLIAGGLMMGAVVYTSLTMSIILMLGFVCACALSWSRVGHGISGGSRWGLLIGFPLVALLGTAPWLINNVPLILPISPSPYVADITLLRDIVLGNGILIVPLGAWGIVIAFRDNAVCRLLNWLMLLWLLLVLDLCLTGVTGRILPPLGALVNAPNLARHGVILPFSWFGGIALLHIWRSLLSERRRRRLHAAAKPLAAVAALLIIASGIAFRPIVDTLRPLLDLPEATVSHDDVAAMTWLREQAEADALLLAADGEGWLPIFAERRAVDLRAVAYFEWEAITAADAPHEIDYVFQPSTGAPLPDLPLRLVFEQGGARVYEVNVGR